MADPFARFSRFPLAHLPTPLVEMKHLRSVLAGRMNTEPPRLFIKRDDCTGLAGGGNKTRKLEFLIGDALQSGCDTIVTAGALQSNHARQTAAAAAAAGLHCVLVLFDSVPYAGQSYRASGNLLLDRILGADIHVEPADADPGTVFARIMEDVESKGGKPYLVPVGGSNAIGSLGYAAAYFELADGLDAFGPGASRVVHASSSGGTQAGLIAGRALRGKGPSIAGVNVYRADTDAMAAGILALAGKTAALFGLAAPDAGAVVLDGDHLGPRYGVPTAGMTAAVECVARAEGVLLDPVYTGKGMAGLIAQVLAGRHADVDTLVFLHTGGMPGLFAYEEEF